ncbi:MAG: MFS transporter [archaeon]|nr:MFS transporter [archaeon]
MNQKKDNFHSKKSKPSKLAFFSSGLAQLPSSMMGAVMSGFLMIYYETVIGLNSYYVFLAMAIFSVYNAINDPLFAFLIDRNMKFTRKYGRRFPWIMISIVPWSLALFLMFNVPDIDVENNPWAVFGWLLFTLFMIDTFGTLRGMNIGAVRTELFRTREDRRKHSKYYTPIDIIAVVVGMLLPTLIEDLFPDKRTGYEATGLIIALISLVVSILILPGFREDKEMIDRYFVDEESEPMSFIKTLKEVVKLKSFIVFFIYSLCYSITLALIVPNLNYLGTFVLQGEVSVFLILIIYLSFTLISIPFWLIYLRKTKNLKKVLVVGGIFFVIALIPLTFFVGKYDLMVYTAILGFANGSTSALISPVLFPSVVDDFVVKTGKNQKAMLFGISAFLGRLVSTIDEGIIALVHNLSGFVEGNESYAEMAAVVSVETMGNIQLGIRLLMGVIPATVLLIGTLVFWKFFPLTTEKIQENKERLHELNL